MGTEITKEFDKETDLLFDEEGYFQMTFQYFWVEMTAEEWFEENGIPRTEGWFEYYVDMRDDDSGHTLRIPFMIDEVEGPDDLEKLFMDEYAQLGIGSCEEPVRIVKCGLIAHGRRESQ